MPDEIKEGKLIGKITHYFGKIGVAIIELSDSLKVGDQIRILGGTTNFTQTIDSMEWEHKKVETAEAGNEVGVKVAEAAKEGYQVYKL